MHSSLLATLAAPRRGPAIREPIVGARLPFTLLPPCEKNRTHQSARHSWVTGTRCQPVNIKPSTWQSKEAPPPFLPAAQVPLVPDAAVAHACGPLRLHTVQRDGVPEMLRNATFWSPWLKRSRSELNHSRTAEQRRRRCETRLRSWKPRICQLSRVYVAGASQVMFNQSTYFGPAPRVSAGIQPLGISTVQARTTHVVLTRNEYGAGYYHMLFDTLASLAFLWPAFKEDPSAKLVLNPCTTGREHLLAKLGGSSASRATAPNIGKACEERPYAKALLTALGVPPERVLRWPYTRQRSGPALQAEHASFMCAHPWQPTFHRGFWYVRQLRQLLHAAFSLPQIDVATAAQTAAEAKQKSERLLVLISRKGCVVDGCDPSRTVRGGPALLAGLRRAFRSDRVVAFTGVEPVAEQAKLFHDAALIAGPHGAAFANAIWCRVGASLIEFHRLNWHSEPNSPLYALLSRSLQLRHWVIADTESTSRMRGYEISSRTLVDTARAALAVAEGRLDDTEYVVELPREEWL